MFDALLDFNLMWTAYALVLLVILGTSRAVKSKGWDIFFTFVFPIFVTTPFVFIVGTMDTLDSPLFTFTKLYSVLFSAACVWYIRNNPKTVWGRKLRTWSFGINIVEVILLELYLGFWINPLAGLLVLLTLPRWKTLVVGKDERKLRWESTLIWIIAYSIWNFTFALNIYPALWFLNLLHVIVALLFVLRDPRWYAHIRATSLNITFATMIAFFPAMEFVISKNIFYGPFESAKSHTDFIFKLSIIALIASVIAVGQQIINKQGRVANLLGLEKTQPKMKAIGK
jgi:Family of unknown function (DUF5692)